MAEIYAYILVLFLGLAAGLLLLRFPPTKLIDPAKRFLNEQGDGAPHFIFAAALLLMAFIVFVILDERPEDLEVGAEGVATTTTTESLSIDQGNINSFGATESLFAKIRQDGTVETVIVADQSFIDSGVVGNPKNWVPTQKDGSEPSAIIGGKYDRRTKTFTP